MNELYYFCYPDGQSQIVRYTNIRIHNEMRYIGYLMREHPTMDGALTRKRVAQFLHITRAYLMEPVFGAIRPLVLEIYRRAELCTCTKVEYDAMLIHLRTACLKCVVHSLKLTVSEGDHTQEVRKEAEKCMMRLRDVQQHQEVAENPNLTVAMGAQMAKERMARYKVDRADLCNAIETAFVLKTLANRPATEKAQAKAYDRLFEDVTPKGSLQFDAAGKFISADQREVAHKMEAKRVDTTTPDSQQSSDSLHSFDFFGPGGIDTSATVYPSLVRSPVEQVLDSIARQQPLAVLMSRDNSNERLPNRDDEESPPEAVNTSDSQRLTSDSQHPSTQNTSSNPELGNTQSTTQSRTQPTRPQEVNDGDFVDYEEEEPEDHHMDVTEAETVALPPQPPTPAAVKEKSYKHKRSRSQEVQEAAD